MGSLSMSREEDTQPRFFILLKPCELHSLIKYLWLAWL